MNLILLSNNFGAGMTSEHGRLIHHWFPQDFPMGFPFFFFFFQLMSKIKPVANIT